MGNQLSNRGFDATGKVILWDGTVQEFNETMTMTVAELMLEHQQQVVVELNSAMTTKKPSPLPADTKLETKKVYVMLPMKRGKPAALSSEQARHIMLTTSSSRGLLPLTKFVPLFARMCSVNVGDIHDSSVLQKEEERPVKRLVLPEISTESLDGRPDLLSRQLSGRGWKPSLDTIIEKKVDKRFPPSLVILKNLSLSFSNLK